MIKLFFNKRGSGKSKELMNIANSESEVINGHSVYIDDNEKRIFSIDKAIRFVSMKEYDVKSYTEFLAFICGILSNDYDIENLYIDNFSKIVKDFDTELLAYYLEDLNKLSKKHNVNVYINAHDDGKIVPDKAKEYISA